MKKTYVVVTMVLVIFLIAGIAGIGFGHDFLVKDRIRTAEGPQWLPDEIIVKFSAGVSDKVIDSINSRHGASVISTSRFAGFKRLRIPAGKTVAEMVEIYSKNPNVEYAEPNFIAHAFMTPDDPLYRYQWNFGNINMEPAWDRAVTCGSDVIVAVVDTGVAYENNEEFVDNPGKGQDYYITYRLASDLASTTFVPGYDFVNDDAHPNDDDGHGTHVTGTIAQSTNNGEGVAGVAFNAAIMPVKVLDESGSGTYADIADGIWFAADQGADIINMSLGGAIGSITLEQAVKYAYERGVTIICASGNDGSATTVSYPAAYDAYCIAVGAVRYDEQVTYYSNGGASLDLTAPGGDTSVDLNQDGYGDGVLQQTFDGNPASFGYWFYQGTSMATPHVSGVAALLIAEGVADTPDEIRQVLQSTAKDKGAAGWDPAYGWGIVDAYAALNYSAGVNSQPVADAGGPYVGTEDEPVQFNGSGSYDPDGDVMTYRWDFGDGSSGAGVSPTHTYAAGGNYDVTLIVNDGKTDSLVATATASIDEVNDPPVADAGPDQTKVAGDVVGFDGSASYDPDAAGSIVSYDWDFGDGSVGTGAYTTHTYSSNGQYTVTLTVTDDGGLTDTDTAVVTITEELALNMHVYSVEMSLKVAGPVVVAYATVRVMDDNDGPVAGATVSGYWSGLTTGAVNGVTDESGTVKFSSGKLKNVKGTFTFTVDTVTKDGWTYEDTGASGSITIP